MATTNTETTSSSKQSTPAARPPEKTPRFLWVTNNESRVRIFALRGSTNAVSRTLQPGPSFELPPGAHVVDAKLWTRWKDENADREVDGENVEGQASMLLRGRIPTDPHSHRRAERAGQPYLVEGPEVKSAGTPLADLEERVALALVPEILDRRMLDRLLGVERRPVIVEALRKKLDEQRRADTAPVI